MQRVKWLIKICQAIISMFLASMAALMISTAPAYANETKGASTDVNDQVGEYTLTGEDIGQSDAAAIGRGAWGSVGPEGSTFVFEPEENATLPIDEDCTILAMSAGGNRADVFSITSPGVSSFDRMAFRAVADPGFDSRSDPNTCADGSRAVNVRGRRA